MKLTDRQKQYIWLAGSHPDRVLVQGAGRKSLRLLYSLDREGEIVVFGYSNPAYFLSQRGLFLRLHGRHRYRLAAPGEREFRKMLANGDGLVLDAAIEKVDLSEEST